MRRLIITVLAVALAACSSTRPSGSGANQSAESTARGRYGAEAGEMTVGIIADATLRDEARKRDVALAIDYPTRAEKAPVIVFSHALGASQLDYAAYSSHWATYGYVVIRVGHVDAVRGFTRKETDIVPATATEWVERAHERARDLSLVLAALPTLDQRYPELAGKIDATRVGVGGHGFGALTAMIAGGVKTFPGATSSADARAKAVLAMSPPGPGERRGLTTESFSTLALPTLFLTGTRDQGGDETETPEWRIQGFDATAPGEKWLVSLVGAGRNTFSGLMMDEPVRERVVYGDPSRNDPGMRPPQRPLSELTGSARIRLAHARAVTLAFWDVYLRGDAAGREFLTTTAKEWGEVRQR